MKMVLLHTAKTKNVLFAILLLSVCLLNVAQEKQQTLSYDPEIIVPTFLGNYQRNYQGNDAPEKLDIIWKLYLGKGETTISRKIGTKIWAGAGWTGQPLLIKENGKLILIQGAYDHNLKKIDAETGNIIWQYKFDDVVKGTGTIWENPDKSNPETSFIILQGSRLGVGNYLDTEFIPSYRGISLQTGKELWRLNVKRTHSYSRDVDGSALIHNNLAYIGLENSLFTVIDPDPAKAKITDGMLQPVILEEKQLYENIDVIKHKYNVVTESSPSILNNRIYVASGSGHVYGYNLKTHQLDWDYYIGSDIDGSAIVTSDSCILVSIEKQYIKGRGGVLKLNPQKPIDNCVEWFFPTKDNDFSGWEGGIIGSVSLFEDSAKSLAGFTAIDGYFYLIDPNSVIKEKTLGFDSIQYFNQPKLLAKHYVGPSISTPAIIKDKIIVASYNGIHLFRIKENSDIQLIDKINAGAESSPIIYNRRVYLASRNGYLYCLGEID